MSIIRKMLKAPAVFWQKTGSDVEGKPIYAQPIQILCRWEYRAVQYLKKDGTTAVSKSVVYVDRDLSEGDKLYNGPLSDLFPEDSNSLDDSNDWDDSNLLLDSNSEDNSEDIHEVQGFEKLPKLRYNEFLRTCYL